LPLVELGTLALAVFTAVLAYATWRLAQAADRQLTLARTQVERAHRPVLVPLQVSGEAVSFRGGIIPAGSGPHITENPADREDLPRYSAAFLPVLNVGMGPALNVRGQFNGPRGSGSVRFPIEGVAVGARTAVAFETWTGESLGYTGNDREVSAVLEYDDVASRTYRTRVTFDVGSNAYRSALETTELPAEPPRRRLPRVRQ
jgi:hypothetical protein